MIKKEKEIEFLIKKKLNVTENFSINSIRSQNVENAFVSFTDSKSTQLFKNKINKLKVF